MEGHAQRPDTRPIEDPADDPKILLAKQGASTHVRSKTPPTIRRYCLPNRGHPHTSDRRPRRRSEDIACQTGGIHTRHDRTSRCRSPCRPDRPGQLLLIGTRTRPDHDITDKDLEIAPCDNRRRRSRAVIDHQFREERQSRHALGQHQVAFAYLLAPIVDLPAGRAVFARNFSDLNPGHHALCRDTRPLCLRAPTTTARPLDYLKPGNPSPHRAAQLDAHFAVYFQNPNPPSRPCAQNGRIKSERAGGGRRSAYGSVVTYRDLDMAREHTVSVVYPENANIEEGRISVLTPVGVALLGLSPGATISWVTRDDETRQLEVLEVRPPLTHD